MGKDINFFLFVIISSVCLFLYFKFKSKQRVVHFVSFPKCGRTWLKYILNKIFIDYYKLQNCQEDSINIRFLATKNKNIPIVIDTHDNSNIVNEDGYRPDPDLMFKDLNKDKYSNKAVLFLVRDPRDVVISHYHQITKRSKDPMTFKNLSDFIRDPVFGLNRIIKFYEVWFHNQSIPKDFSFIKYEDILSDGVNSVKNILDFIIPDNNIPVSIIKKAYDESAAEKMRSKEKQNLIEGFNSFGDKHDYLKVRNAVSGSYLKEMSSEDIDFCNEMMKDKITFLNYN